MGFRKAPSQQAWAVPRAYRRRRGGKQWHVPQKAAPARARAPGPGGRSMGLGVHRMKGGARGQKQAGERGAAPRGRAAACRSGAAAGRAASAPTAGGRASARRADRRGRGRRPGRSGHCSVRARGVRGVRHSAGHREGQCLWELAGVLLGRGAKPTGLVLSAGPWPLGVVAPGAANSGAKAGQHRRQGGKVRVLKALSHPLTGEASVLRLCPTAAGAGPGAARLWGGGRARGGGEG
ncbi:MAG: hypothetical protein J3K34DRAFT_185806 [Monoraphidium minutum]|nr:MAG: hypothetical protein J3K34DRAFT_185806 [Monoraphidium minutum]